MSEKLRKMRRMGRRRFLRTLSSIGVSATTLNYITKDTLAKVTSNPRKEVPYVKLLRHTNPAEVKNGAVPKREPIWDTIPRSKWVRVEAAHDGAKKINSLLDRTFGSKLISAGVKSRNEDPYQKEIAVTYATIQHSDGTVSSPSVPFSEVESTLPSSISGKAGGGNDAETIESIPLVAEKQRHVEDGDCPGDVYNEDQGDMIPGGTRIGDSGDNGTTGTAATRDSDGQNVMISCGHVLENSDHFHQPGDYKSDEDLDVVNATNSGPDDYGYAKPYGGETFYRELASNHGGWKPTDVKGIVTWDTLKNHEGDTNYEIRKQGNRTGTSKGHITETVEFSGGEKKVWTSCTRGGGDSGGPHYRRIQFNRTDETYITAIHAWGRYTDGCGTGEAGGNPVEYIENELSLTV